MIENIWTQKHPKLLGKYTNSVLILFWQFKPWLRTHINDILATQDMEKLPRSFVFYLWGILINQFQHDQARAVQFWKETNIYQRNPILLCYLNTWKEISRVWTMRTLLNLCPLAPAFPFHKSFHLTQARTFSLVSFYLSPHFTIPFMSHTFQKMPLADFPSLPRCPLWDALDFPQGLHSSLLFSSWLQESEVDAKQVVSGDFPSSMCMGKWQYCWEGGKGEQENMVYFWRQ